MTHDIRVSRPLPTNGPWKYHRPNWGINRLLFTLLWWRLQAWRWVIRNW